MKVVVSPDSFKDALGAGAASEAMAAGVLAGCPGAAVVRCPIADGGEGFLEALATTGGVEVREAWVCGPLGERVAARWGLMRSGSGLVGVVELAQAAGLELVATADRDPTRTTTFGVGELVGCALAAGATEVLLGVGGSATNDGGCGLAQALGVRFFDRDGVVMETPMTGGDLLRVGRVDGSGLDGRLKRGALRVACDVTNPLFGERGAAWVFGGQKGGDAGQLERLDAGLRGLAGLWREAGWLGGEARMAGFGAAGGTAGGAVAMLGARLEPGAELVLDAVGFDDLVLGTDLVLTGEGRLDGQSVSGKAVLKVSGRAASAGVPTVALVGSVGEGASACLKSSGRGDGLERWVVIGEGLSAAESIERCAELLSSAAERVVRGWVS